MDLYNLDDIEFQSDEEVWEMLDNVAVAVGEAIAADESKPAILNPIKVRQMQFAYGVLKYLTKGTGAQISYEMCEPYKSMGSISVEGANLAFANPEWFARAAEFASNTEIYPLMNGKVRMTLTFHGLVRPME